MIRTNRNWRHFKFRYEVPPEILESEFDWMKERDPDTGAKEWPEDEYVDGFICYRGFWYHLSQFMRGGDPGWDGSLADSYFSGIVIKLSDDGESYQIGTWIHTSGD